jgi:NitT/TauT family transport system permease protein
MAKASNTALPRRRAAGTRSVSGATDTLEATGATDTLEASGTPGALEASGTPGALEAADGKGALRRLLSAANDRLAGLYLVILFFVVWQLLPSLALVDPIYFPSLSTVLQVGYKLGLSTILSDIGRSLLRVLIGFGLATLVALPTGFALAGAFPRLAKFFNPLMTFLSQIPPFILLPVFVLMFKVGEGSICAVIFWAAFWPILFSTMLGIGTVDPQLVKAARSMGADRFTIFTDVVIPGALPSIMTGLRYGMTFTFMMLIGAESLGSFTGMGYELIVAQRRVQIPNIYFMVLVIAVVGIAVNYLLEALERRVIVWRRDGEGTVV